MKALGHLLDFCWSYNNLATKVHSSVFIPSEIYIQRVNPPKKWNPTGEKFWVLIIWTISTAGLILKNCKKLFHIASKNKNSFKCIITICIYCSARFIIWNIFHRCCFNYYGKSFTRYEIPIFDTADGRINCWKWNHQSNYLQNKRKVWFWFANIFKWRTYFDKEL